MNKHMKIVVSTLFIVIILLTVAISRFYSDTTKTTKKGSAQTDIEKTHGSDALGNKIFENSGGLYGIIDSSERIIVAPEWSELSFADNGKCIAKTKLKNTLLSGCIDYEGNIVIPLIYKNINKNLSGNLLFYTAEVAADGSWVVYDKNFNPCFKHSWKECAINGNTLTLADNNGVFTYSVGSEGMVLSNAVVYGNVLGCDYSFNVESRVLLSKLEPRMLETISAATAKYLEYAYTGDKSCLLGINASDGLKTLFPEERRVIERKLKNISDIFTYSLNYQNGVRRFAVSITAETEITYAGIDGKRNLLTESCKGFLEFSGNSESSLKIVSGSFFPDKPDYTDSENDPKNNEENMPPPYPDGEQR